MEGLPLHVVVGPTSLQVSSASSWEGKLKMKQPIKKRMKNETCQDNLQGETETCICLSLPLTSVV